MTRGRAPPPPPPPPLLLGHTGGRGGGRGGGIARTVKSLSITMARGSIRAPTKRGSETRRSVSYWRRGRGQVNRFMGDIIHIPILSCVRGFELWGRGRVGERWERRDAERRGRDKEETGGQVGGEEGGEGEMQREEMRTLNLVNVSHLFTGSSCVQCTGTIHTVTHRAVWERKTPCVVH